MNRNYSSFAELPPSELHLINRIYNGSALDKVVIQRFNIKITVGTLHLLKENTWLNDEVVNFYLELIKENDTFVNSSVSERSYFANTYFYGQLRDAHGVFCYENVQSWVRETNIFSFKYLFFPINIRSSHWTLVVIEMSSKRIYFYDSLNDNCTYLKMDVFNLWLDREYERNYGDKEKFERFEVINGLCPQQPNGNDCGVYILAFVLLRYRDLDLYEFHQRHVPSMRKRIALSLAKGLLLVMK